MNSADSITVCISASGMLTAALIIVVLFLVVIFFLANKNARCSLDMPGPWRLPCIGCMYLFTWSAQPHTTLARLAAVYGNVYCLKLGRTETVILNFTIAVKEALFLKGSDFAGRPTLFSFGLWNTNKNSMMLMDLSSDFVRCKDAAEIAMRLLINEPHILSCRVFKTLDSLLESIGASTLQESSLDPKEAILACIADLVMDNMFGQSVSRWFYHEARDALERSLVIVDTAYVGACMDFVPVMRYLSQKDIKKTTSNSEQLREFVRKVYTVHSNSMLEHEDYRTSLALFLRSYRGDRPLSFKQDSDSTGLEEDTIISLLTDIMFNAYEKLSTCFRWCVARVAANQTLQQELRDQLVLVGERTLSLDDKAHIPLLEATILETLRTTCVLPFGLPRKTVRDTVVCGFSIPKDTPVFINLWSCCNDPQVYPEPQLFNPRRFLTIDSYGKTTVKSSSFCTFSSGDRKCLGDTFSRSVLFLLTGRLLQNFEIELEKPDPNSKLEGKYALSLRPKPHKIRVRRRPQINVP